MGWNQKADYTESHYLTTNQSEECPGANQALLLEHCRLLTNPLQGRTQSSQGVSPLWASLPGKAINYYFLLHPKLCVCISIQHW